MRSGVPMATMPEAMLMIRPERWLFITGATAREQSQTPLTLTRRIADAFGVLVIMLFGGVLIQQGWKLVELGQFQQTPVMGLSKVYVYASMPVGGALVILYSLRHLWRAVTGAPTATHGS